MTRFFTPLLLIACAAACATTDPAVRERQGQARAATELGDWRRAASLWYGLYREDPGADAEVAAGAAEALYESGDPTSALAVVLDSRRLGADTAELRHTGALALAALGQRERAIEELRAALVEEPEQVGWWWTLAGWTWAEGQARPTRRALEQVVALGRDGPEVQLLVARVQTRLDALVPAYDAWCVALGPRGETIGGAGDAEALLEGARVAASPRLANERPDALAQAVRWYQRTTSLEPQEVSAHRELADAARLAGDAELCLAALERASELDPTDSSLLADLAGVCAADGDTERARQLLQRALDLETDPEWHAEWRRRLAVVDGLIAPE